MSTITLYYIHDPMCSWCWGFRRTWQKLQAQLPPDVAVEYVIGGLAPDTDEPMPPETREYLQATWHKIHDSLGAEFNFAFWDLCQPRRATYPACRAVIAAQNQEHGKAMIEAIQKAYYTRAMNPSEDATLLELAAELDLDLARFSEDLNSEETRQELARQIAYGQALGAQGFPSLVLEIGRSRWPVGLNYRDADEMLASIRMLIEAA